MTFYTKFTSLFANKNSLDSIQHKTNESKKSRFKSLNNESNAIDKLILENNKKLVFYVYF